MSKRVSVEIVGFNHGQQPIPAASKVGPLLMTGGVYGLDRATGKIPDDVGEQARLMFENLALILEAAGGSLDSIAKVTIHAKVPQARPAVNVEWLKHFADPASRPARHTLVNEALPANMLVQCDAVAWIEGS